MSRWRLDGFQLAPQPGIFHHQRRRVGCWRAATLGGPPAAESCP